jgi:8-oxo-dGTP pyrophosphatase MutT (NUDIX family)
VLEHESVADAAVRETFEETGVRVAPGAVLLIEDILAITSRCAGSGSPVTSWPVT